MAMVSWLEPHRLQELLPLDWLLRPEPGPAEALPPAGLRGLTPLPWWAAGPYDTSLRQEILELRRDGRAARMAPLLPGLLRSLASVRPALLVPIPSWKTRANPLPALLARQLSARLHWPVDPAPLIRSRPVLGQHRLGRALRWENQRGSFAAALPPHHPGFAHRGRTVLLVDDILTTGATAAAAAEALGNRGWRVAGLICLARTPAERAGGRQ
jgi:predicted amidophosphoribosyltransferase